MADLTPKKRRWIVHRMQEGGRSVGWIAASMGCSRQACYAMFRAFEVGGGPALEDQPRGRRPIVKPLTREQRIRLVEIRRETGYGALRLEAVMREGIPQWPPDWPVPTHHRINAVFREAGLIREGTTRGKKPTYIRFERDHSNSLWQTDWHWLAQEEAWLIVYIDDHSRFVPGAGSFDEPTTANSLKVFEAAAQRFGHPNQVLSDHGSQFTGTHPNAVRHRFPERLAELGTEHIMGQVKKPTTTGKIERFFFTYEDELRRFPDLETRIHHYNFQRHHQSLGYKLPAIIFGQDLPLETPNRDQMLETLTSQLPSWATGGK